MIVSSPAPHNLLHLLLLEVDVVFAGGCWGGAPELEVPPEGVGPALGLQTGLERWRTGPGRQDLRTGSGGLSRG